MKFGKEFIKQMVPEWTEAYMDYYGLKNILHEIRQYKQKNQRTLSRASQHKKLFGRTVSGLKQQSSSHHSENTEEQVIDVTTSQQDGSKEVYETNILKQSEEGGDTDADFFRKLDEELNKVNTFYKDKVEEEKNEASQLIKQLDALNALRIKVKKPHFNGSTAENDNSFGGSEHCHSAKNTGGESNSLTPVMDANDKKQQEQREKTAGASEVAPAHTNNFHSGESKISDYKEDQVLEHVKKNNTLQSPMSTLKGVFKDSKEEELSFNKEELKKAEERLRVAFIEFYHKLHLLKHYSFANLSAFSKVMEKYEKITSRRAFRSYMEVVDGSYLGNSDEINGLLDRVEATFIRNFSNSNRREGMKSLRPKAKRERHRVTFLSGFFSGCALALLVAVILRIEVQNIMDKQVGKQYMQSIFPLYSLFLYIILHMYMYAANLLFWRRYRVNYPFIFGFKRGTELGYREVFLLSTGILVLALAGFLANWHLDMDSSTQNYKTVTELVPLGLLTLILVIAFCPFDIIYRSSRFFFIRRIFRIICTPFYPVTMADFFLADQLTSQMQALRISVLYVCYYGLGEYSRRQNKCHSRGVYNTLYFIVAVIPFWFRFLQCIRRLYKDRDPIHGYNGVKYFSTIVAVLIRTAAELRKGTTWMVLALVSSAVATLMNTYWDIGVDWGLLRRHSKNKYLRDRLLISHKSVYFISMVINVVLRLVWMQQVLEFNLHTIHKMTITAIISCLEIIRRGIWSFFRLENEHLNNVGKYRAFKSVPLPFCYSDEETDEDADKDD